MCKQMLHSEHSSAQSCVHRSCSSVTVYSWSLEVTAHVVLPVVGTNLENIVIN